MKKVVILDYGTGNILSIKSVLNLIGIKPIITNNKKKILNASHLILPGVGAFGTGMKNLNKFNLSKVIKEYSQKKKPILGICLGMQLLFEESSEFGRHKGLCLLEGKVEKINFKKIYTPVIGWYKLNAKKNSKIFKFNKKFMYFVHSYQCIPKDKKIINSTYNIFNNKIIAGVEKNNILGLQFHPEKSSVHGINIIKKFLNK